MKARSARQTNTRVEVSIEQRAQRTPHRSALATFIMWHTIVCRATIKYGVVDILAVFCSCLLDVMIEAESDDGVDNQRHSHSKLSCPQGVEPIAKRSLRL